jgi:glycine oxidase
MSEDLLIVGGGAIGCAIACEMAHEGWKVRVLDRQKPGSEASWAAAGMLSPSAEAAHLPALVPLSRAALDLYPSFIEDLESTAGIRTDFQRQGSLVAFFGSDANHAQGEFLATLARTGLGGEPVTGEEARRQEPSLNPEVAAGVWFAEEASVDPRALGRALRVTAERRGVKIEAGTEVFRVIIEGGRCRGVATASGEITAGRVVIASGCYSGAIEGAARYAPTRPVRGQMVALDGGPARPQTMIRSERGYLVPRPDGRVLAGSTLENTGFDKSVTAGGLRKILNGASEMAPALENAAILETWAGLRPDSPDHLPILGPTEIENLSIATGHYRDGILLAPVTARLARAWLLGQPTDVPIETFSPQRFPAPKASSNQA